VKSNFDNLAASLCCRALIMHEVMDEMTTIDTSIQGHLFHHSNQQLIAIVPVKSLKYHVAKSNA